METSVTMNTLFLYILLVCGLADVLVQGKADGLLLLTRLIIIILSVSLPVCLPLCLSQSVPACLPVCLSVCLPACLFVCLSVCLPRCLSVCLYVSLSLSLSLSLPPPQLWPSASNYFGNVKCVHFTRFSSCGLLPPPPPPSPPASVMCFSDHILSFSFLLKSNMYSTF